MDKSKLYRAIPKVDVLLEKDAICRMIDVHGRQIVMMALRDAMEHIREQIAKDADEEKVMAMIAGLDEDIHERCLRIRMPHMKTVINATGTILHTNLGRAPICREHAMKMMELVTGYSNLEYNLVQGKRGERYAHFEKLLCDITGAEAAMAVNNNAAAVMLVLSSMAKGGEVVVSRGELVEIGGKFRIPDVMEQSGAVLVEVGTTNKTHLADYKDAITENTKALLKVHTSNYRIVGFSELVPVSELRPVADEAGIPIIEDLGSGVLVDLSKYGLTYEPTVQDSLKAGADVVCFSGDKLLGGPQAGVIVGKKKYIDLMKKNQLTRALRIDKFTASALELTLLEYLDEEKAVRSIPVLKMIRESEESVQERALKLKKILEEADLAAEIGIEPCLSQIGGGSLPLERLGGYAVTVRPLHMTDLELERSLRQLEYPIIARIGNDRISLAVRTIDSEWFDIIAKMLKSILQG